MATAVGRMRKEIKEGKSYHGEKPAFSPFLVNPDRSHYLNKTHPNPKFKPVKDYA
jgi:hypothetical protein